MAGAGIDRRTWMVGTACGVTLLACDRGRDRGAPATVPPEAAALFAELGPGTRLDRWTIVAVHPVRHGALPVVLRAGDGAPYQIDVLSRDSAGPPGVAQTRALSLFVVNRGDGDTPTDEEQGLGAMALAQALAEREAAGASLPTLSTFAERQAEHPDGAFAVPLG